MANRKPLQPTTDHVGDDPAIRVTGVEQLESWGRRTIPPVERLPGGVWSIPVAIPDHPMRYTLCYVVESDKGPVLIDPGWRAETSWECLLTGLRLAGVAAAEIHGVLLTHAHTDHYGLAARVRAESGCWVGMHPIEIEFLRRARQGATTRQQQRFLAMVGVPDAEMAEMTETAGMNITVDLIPDRSIEDGRGTLIPGRHIRSLWTPGHTAGHLCFVDEEHQRVFTGDHFLPRITANVPCYSATSGDTLGRYLASVQSIASLADGYEVLPAHEYRFRGLRARAHAIEQHHEARLAEIISVVREVGTATVWTIAARVQWARGWEETTGVRRRLALAETLSHVRRLEVTGRLRSAVDTPPQWSVTS